MAAELLVRLKLKQELTDAELEPVKGEFEGKLKARIKKEKNKGKQLEWLVVAKKPELVEEGGIFTVFKRAKLEKMLKGVEVEEYK